MHHAIIPVAGLGTRALPASKAIPKEMMPLYDRPIVQYIVEEAASAKISDIIFVTSKGKACIEDHFKISPEIENALLKAKKKEMYDLVYDLSRKVKVQSVMQHEPLGLGHAVLMAKPLITQSHFAVLLGDDVIEAKTPGIQQVSTVCKKPEEGAVLLMEVPASEVSKYGICEVDNGKVVRCVEKPKVGEMKSRLAIIGRYFLPKDTFNILEGLKPGPLGEIQLTDGLNELAKQKRLHGVILKGERFDAGDRLGFLKANLYYYLKSPLKSDVQKLLKDCIETRRF